MEIKTPICHSVCTKLFVIAMLVTTKTKNKFMSITGE